MTTLNKFLLLVAVGLLISIDISAQHRPIDALKKTDRFGFTTMFYYSYRNWGDGSRKTKGSLRFDSFRIWAQTDIDKKFFGAVQYRFYEGWSTPLYLYVGYNINEQNKIQLGQTWVPFGIDYQPFDDWGNITYYVGLQDDYDYGAVWTGTYGQFELNAAFFKNQQLSSSSPMRYDTDIYSGDPGSDDLITTSKLNQEINQVNFRFAFKPSGDNWKMNLGASALIGGLFNQETQQSGSRYAAALHYGIDIDFFHYNIQGTWYNYSQKLPATVENSNDFINVSSWNFAYEIPAKANILTTSAAFDIIGEKLTIHANYSYLWGGTSMAASQLFTCGARTLWDSFEVFAEAYYGVNDPQLSGNASGYGRNANSYDLRVDVRFFYKLKIVSEETIERYKKN